MNHNHVPSNGNLSPSQQEVEVRYREELMNRAVSESEGNTALYLSIDLNREEQKKHLAATEARLARSGGSRLPGHGSYTGGFDNYGDKSWTNYESAIPPEVNNEYKNSSYENVQFLKEKDGKVPIVYDYNGYTDNTGRPGSIKLGFSVSPETAREIQANVQNDPTIIDQIVNGQLSALGLDDRLRGGLGSFNLDMGRLKNFAPDPDRKKIIYSYGDNGQLVRDEVMYRDKKSLEVFGMAEQMQSVEQASTPVHETYDVEENARANKLRQKIVEMKQQGLSHLDIALSVKDDGLNIDPNADLSEVKAYDTVYSELMSEQLDSDEFRQLGLTNENYADVEATLREEIEGTIEFFAADDESRKRAIDVLNDECARLDQLTNGDLPEDIREACVLKLAVMSEVLEELEAEQ